MEEKEKALKNNHIKPIFPACRKSKSCVFPFSTDPVPQGPQESPQMKRRDQSEPNFKQDRNEPNFKEEKTEEHEKKPENSFRLFSMND